MMLGGWKKYRFFLQMVVFHGDLPSRIHKKSPTNQTKHDHKPLPNLKKMVIQLKNN